MKELMPKYYCKQARGKAGSGWPADHPDVRPWAVTTLNLGHVSNFLASNISRKQTRQYRKSTKEATSGKRCERKRETDNCSKKPVSRPNNASSDRRSLQKFHRKQSVCSKYHQMWGRQSRHHRPHCLSASKAFHFVNNYCNR